ncbi:site-specific DNA-methyltransferase (adenine-specific) [Trueperella pyogenes]|uniref:site-specific DNA-methyltransferase (adenine-specific) n=1 Tax=Trueperella pyogenes TaxID=1661 RepID=UPI001ADCC947|nr:site-specific DNA-methyltransferase (adenine-specific) [Trueperella pyogenes]
MEEIKAMDLESKDLVAERIEQMKALFPEIVVEGDGSIDFEKLRLILGDEVEGGDERYAFTWPGKADAIRQSQTVSTATLRPCPENSVNWDTTHNLLLMCDKEVIEV